MGNVMGAALIAWSLADTVPQCPAVQELTARVRALTGSDSSSLSSGRVAVTESDDRVTLRLAAPDGAILAERQLPASLTCLQRVEAAAVIVATWDAKFSPGAMPFFGLTPPTPAATEATRPPAGAFAPPPPVHIALSLGAGGVFSPGQLSPTTTLMLDASPFVHLGFFVSGSGGWGERTAVGAGTVLAHNFVFGAGASYRWTARNDDHVVAYIGPGASYLLASGENFQANLSASGFSPALVTGVRWTRRGGNWRPWLGVAGTAYGSRHVTVSGGAANQRKQLESWDFRVLAGIQFSLFR